MAVVDFIVDFSSCDCKCMTIRDVSIPTIPDDLCSDSSFTDLKNIEKTDFVIKTPSGKQYIIDKDFLPFSDGVQICASDLVEGEDVEIYDNCGNVIEDDCGCGDTSLVYKKSAKKCESILTDGCYEITYRLYSKESYISYERDYSISFITNNPSNKDVYLSKNGVYEDITSTCTIVGTNISCTILSSTDELGIVELRDGDTVLQSTYPTVLEEREVVIYPTVPTVKYSIQKKFINVCNLKSKICKSIKDLEIGGKSCIGKGKMERNTEIALLIIKLNHLASCEDIDCECISGFLKTANMILDDC